MSRPFHIALVVWGDKFVETLIHVALPNHLSEGNIPDLPRSSAGPHVYHIFTTRSDALVIERSRAFERLRRSIRVEFHDIDDLVQNIHAGTLDKHDVMTRCHAKACRIAAREKGALLVLGPELIISRGLFQALHHRLQCGARVVLVGSYRSTKELAVPALLEQYYSPESGRLTIASRELVALSLKYFHRWSRSLCWQSRNFESPWPAFLYWPVGTQGLLQRGIHLCPLLSIPRRGDELDAAPRGRGIDGTDYVDRIDPDFDDVHVVTDSDELCVMGLTEDGPDRPDDVPNVFQIALWMTNHTFPNHLRFFREKIRFHATELSDEWTTVESASDQVVEEIFACYQLLESCPLAKTHVQRLLDGQKVIAQFANSIMKEGALAYAALGLEYHVNGKSHDAEEALRRAITWNPEQKDAHYLLGVLYETQLQFDKALDHLKTSATLQPDNVNVWKRLLSLALRLGHMQLATECENRLGTLTR